MKKNNNGFTLVELLIYMALMAIFLTVLLNIFTTTLKTKLAMESTSALSYDSRYVLSKIAYDVNNTDSVTSPTLGVTGTSLTLTSGGVISTYTLTGGNLVKTAGGVSMSLNGTDTEFDSISFKNLGNAGGKPTIQVVYTLESKIIIQGERSETQTINTTVGTR
jgi:prepilin-type N-terminal cleavage/methylation domain-containing protein